MLMIRFQRIGRKNDAAFRMAVLEKTAGPKAGKYVDLVGTYNPKTKQITYKAERIQEWIAKGAQVSPSLKNLLIKNGVLTGEKTAVISKKNLEKNVAKKAEEEAAAKAAAEEAAKAEAAKAAEAAEAPVAEEVPAAEEAAPAEETPKEEEEVAA
ncbi:30S ribosomal protein S16 [Patescibacteria group bacterium]|nr:30S ribosomal protein S16 [Patescibacteria group bacterium]MBU1501062.1 30S ribosomal protein S16 [Patescibacteria group bacterium]MBU2081065.1 30S ribosomal protein S16 [Patescibacteria group bacterium]MBU2124156.1 30S ribosomal protein S16 [Patescibacteria group bacterium]MBU2195012.1 30S ribosomal protein S16 [Patescibacteria group bacterium]